jgi:hypothetical protein
MLMPLLDARGHYTIGKEMVESVIDRIRRVAGTVFPINLLFVLFLTRPQTIARHSKGS